MIIMYLPKYVSKSLLFIRLIYVYIAYLIFVLFLALVKDIVKFLFNGKQRSDVSRSYTRYEILAILDKKIIH